MQGMERFFFFFSSEEKTPSVAFEQLGALLRGESRLSRQVDILIVVCDAKCQLAAPAGLTAGRDAAAVAKWKEKSLNIEDLERMSRLKATCHPDVEIQRSD